ncbi:MAG TPA: hypothetical protein VGJ26_08880 [Pirellulales bacterium]
MNQQNVGVFGWIREGVRRAVLLGFSDAVEQVGGADDKESLSPHLQSLLREPPRRLAEENRAAEPIVASRSDRKRLGRSLGQISGQSGGAGALGD